MVTLPYLLVAFGLCFWLQHKADFLHGWSQTLDSMLECSFCTGFHCGWVVWFLSWGISGQAPAEGWVTIASQAAWGFASASFCYVLDAVVQWLEAKA